MKALRVEVFYLNELTTGFFCIDLEIFNVGLEDWVKFSEETDYFTVRAYSREERTKELEKEWDFALTFNDGPRFKRRSELIMGRWGTANVYANINPEATIVPAKNIGELLDREATPLSLVQSMEVEHEYS